jgi:hypothetical protein
VLKKNVWPESEFTKINPNHTSPTKTFSSEGKSQQICSQPAECFLLELSIMPPEFATAKKFSGHFFYKVISLSKNFPLEEFAPYCCDTGLYLLQPFPDKLSLCLDFF